MQPFTKDQAGLGNVDNTSDANKPVSTAQQSALDLKLNLAGGTLTGQLNLAGGGTGSQAITATEAQTRANSAQAAAIAAAALDATDKANAAQAAAIQRADHTGTQLASTISDFDAQVRSSRLDQMAAPTADLTIGGHKLTNVGTPTSSADAVNKSYADNLLSNVYKGKGDLEGALSYFDTLPIPVAYAAQAAGIRAHLAAS